MLDDGSPALGSYGHDQAITPNMDRTDEVKNLASDPKYKQDLEPLRGVLNRWIGDTLDLGEVPEAELLKRGVLRAQPPAGR